MSDSTIDLDKLERLEREATPGPWEPETWCGEYDPGWCGVGPLCLPSGEEDPDDDGPESPCATRAATDAALIAALRNAAPAMIAELRAARECIAELDAPKKTDPDLFQIAVRLAAGHADASDAWALLEEVERLRKRVAELEGGDQ